MKIKRFEDLDCWKESKELTKLIYDVIKKENFNRDFALKDQTIRACISVMNNIAEGFDSQSNNEFIRFLVMSRRSVSELQTCLYIAVDQNYLTQGEFNTIFNQSTKTKQLIDGFLRYLREHRRSKRE